MKFTENIWNSMRFAGERSEVAGLWETLCYRHRTAAFRGSERLFSLSFAFLRESIWDVYYTFLSCIFSAVNRKTQGGL